MLAGGAPFHSPGVALPFSRSLREGGYVIMTAHIRGDLTPEAIRRSALNRAKLAAIMLGGCVTGALILGFPALLSEHRSASFFVIVRHIVEGLSLGQVLLLAIAGFVWGLVLDRPYSLYAAAAQFASLPIIAVLEMIKDPTSHNLWPFEFLIYGVLAGISAACARGGEFLRTRFSGQ